MGAGLSKKAKERLNAAKREGGTELNFSECGIQDFRQFGPVVAMNKLVVLNLSRNYIAELPPTIERLKQITDLDLSNNQITKICPEMVSMVNLKRLVLSDNPLTDLCPMGSFKSLTYLDISNDRIQNIPADLLQTGLLHFKLGNNGFSVVPTLVWDFGPRLKTLCVNGNRLGPRLADSITRLQSLEHLDISNCEIPTLPQSVCSMVSLKRLYFGKNNIEVIPAEFTKLVNLEIMDGSENQISNMSQVSFKRYSALVEINFSVNRLKVVPYGLGACKKLRVINFGKNPIERMPREIGWLEQSLRKVDFSATMLEKLPGELCFLTPSLDLNLQNCAQLKFPFREWYTKGTPYLIDNLKPYCSAHPGTSFATGPELNNTFCGNPTVFLIKANDKAGDPRASGGDTFTAEIVNPADKSVVEQIVIHDEKNGAYKGFYNCRKAGKFELHVYSEGEPVKGSPYPLNVAPGPTFGPNCTVTGDQLKKGIVGISNSFNITSYDKFGNKRTAGGDNYTVTIEGGSKPRATVVDNKDGTYTVSFTPGWAAEYEINIKLGTTTIQGCPFFCDCK